MRDNDNQSKQHYHKEILLMAVHFLTWTVWGYPQLSTFLSGVIIWHLFGHWVGLQNLYGIATYLICAVRHHSIPPHLILKST
jgi:hypothetical protein